MGVVVLGAGLVCTARQSPVDSRVIIARRDGSCSSGAGLAGRGDRRTRIGAVKRRSGAARSMAAARVPLWAVCVLRVALATVYFQEEFLDGGEEATPMVAGV